MSRPRRTPFSGSSVWICLCLALLACAVYFPAHRCGFLRLDDDVYVTDNPLVREGLTLEGLRWALRSTDADNWHPLTWVSLMLDVSVFGLDPRGMHAVNVALHALSAALLFLALHRLTGERGASALVAALFAVHPLRVEAVAWVAERKEVLAGLFFMLTLIAYTRHARRPGTGSYLLVAAALAAGLLAKPMLVSVPALLLVLDFWPLGRRALPRLLAEKLPLLALSLGSALATVSAQSRGGALGSFQAIPLGARVANAAAAYAAYLGQAFWPARLAVFYPHPATYPADRLHALTLPAILSGALLASVSLLVARSARRRPYLAAGWCWYLGMLVPVIGIVQVGMQARADRYTYLPLIGIELAVVWLARDLARERGLERLARAAALAVLALLAAATWRQIGYWRDDVTLYEHALRVTSDNYLAHNNLGVELSRRGRLAPAAEQFQAAIRIKPDYPDALVNLGAASLSSGRSGEAAELFARAARSAPSLPRAWSGLGAARLRLGDARAARGAFEEALRLDPGFEEGQNGLGVVWMEQGGLDEAARRFEAALALRPDYPEAHCNLGKVLRAAGRADEAARHQDAALRARPDYAEAHRELGLLLAARGERELALAHIRRARELSPADPRLRRDLDSLESHSP